MGTLIALVLAILAAALVIWIVSKLGLGLSVDGWMAAIIAAIVIAVIGYLIYWLLGVLGISIPGGWLGAIINLIIAAVVLLLGGRWLSGLQVEGFVGAIVAAISIGVVTSIINWLVGLLGF